jgi:hypothetical protein
MNNDETKNILFQKKWSDKYLCYLAALDHCNEIIALNRRRAEIKAEFEGKEKDTKVEMINLSIENEIVDLKIILDFYLNEKENLVEERLEKFLAKLDPGNKNK